jgi:hypothetical protein
MIDPAYSTRSNAVHTDRFATDYTYYHPHGFWWGPVLAGAVSAIALQLLFTVLGLAIGIIVADAGDSADAGAISTAAGAWWLITGTIALALGGVVVGCLWGHYSNISLHLHSFAMWSIVAIFGFVVIWSSAGLATQAASPLATIASQYDIDPQQTMDRARSADPDAADTSRVAEEAEDAATAAAWWSLIGLIIGIVATLIGGVVGTKIAEADQVRETHDTRENRDTQTTRV